MNPNSDTKNGKERSQTVGERRLRRSIPYRFWCVRESQPRRKLKCPEGRAPVAPLGPTLLSKMSAPDNSAETLARTVGHELIEYGINVVYFELVSVTMAQREISGQRAAE